MGNHYVPQAYLRGFATPQDPDQIWMFDRADSSWRKAAINRVAQQRGYYDAETEKALRTDIEGPAHIALAKLRARPDLSHDERFDLTRYISCLMRRVPRGRRRTVELLDKASMIDDVIDRLRDEIVEAIQHRGENTEGAGVLGQLEGLRAKYHETPSENLASWIHQPWPLMGSTRALYEMTWRVIHSEDDSTFLTSDNPAHFFEGIGLGHEHSEIAFPLATHLGLIANWQGPRRQSFLAVGRQREIVREINRRTIAGAERFIFSHREAPWVAGIAQRKNPKFLRVVWSDVASKKAEPPPSAEELMPPDERSRFRNWRLTGGQSDRKR